MKLHSLHATDSMFFVKSGELKETRGEGNSKTESLRIGRMKQDYEKNELGSSGI